MVSAFLVKVSDACVVNVRLCVSVCVRVSVSVKESNTENHHVYFSDMKIGK